MASIEKKVAIIGSGPAGLTAGIYTARAGIKAFIYTGSLLGGQLTTTTEVENFPVAWNIQENKGMMGPEMMNIITKQAEHFGAQLIYDSVTKLEVIDNKDKNNNEKKFILTNTFGEESTYDAVIIASGASARYLNLSNEEKWIGKGYHTCATCDGFFYKNKVVAVVGGGDSAMEEAHYLSSLASKVYLIHRSNTFKASAIMLDRVKKVSNIEFILDSAVEDFIINDEDKFSGVKLKNNQNNTISNLNVSGLFVAIGHIPSSSFVKDILKSDEMGYLISRKDLLSSKLASGEKVETDYALYQNMSEIEGIFIAGDVSDKIYRQAITASGEGCRAAIDCYRWLESR
jgi:thioredoxin reductase (NADPH)